MNDLSSHCAVVAALNFGNSTTSIRIRVRVRVRVRVSGGVGLEQFLSGGRVRVRIRREVFIMRTIRGSNSD